MRKLSSNAVFRGTSWNLFGSMIGRGATLASAIALARIVGADGLGAFSLVSTTISVLVVVAALGMNVATARNVQPLLKSRPDSLGDFISGMLAMVVAASFFCAVIMIVVFPAVSSLVGFHFERPVAFFVGLIVFAQSINLVLASILVGFRSFKKQAVIQLIDGVSLAICIVAGAAARGLNGVFLGWALVELAVVVIQFFVVRSLMGQYNIGLKCKNWSTPVQILRRFGVPSMLASSILLPVTWIAMMMLSQSSGGIGAVGVYSAAQRWYLLLLFVPTAVTTVLLPIVSRDGVNVGTAKDTTSMTVYKTLGILMALVSVGAMGVLMLLHFAPNLYGSEFSGLTAVMTIMCASAVAATANLVLGTEMVAIGRAWRRAGYDVLLSLVLLVTALFAIPAWQEIGLALAQFVAFAGVSACMFVELRRRHA